MAEHLEAAIQSHTPDFSAKGSLLRWARDLDLAIRVDGRTRLELERCVDWIHRSPSGAFWRANVLSGKKLRAQFERLRIEARERASSARASPAGGGRGLTPEEIREMAARMREAEVANGDG